MNKPVRCIDYSSVSTIVSNGFWNCDVCVVVVFVCYNFTCYCCLIDNLHTSCSGLHNKYICIQVDRAKEMRQRVRYRWHEILLFMGED
jgi:hypothetical protein